jgi:hypothetical protein
MVNRHSGFSLLIKQGTFKKNKFCTNKIRACYLHSSSETHNNLILLRNSRLYKYFFKYVIQKKKRKQKEKRKKKQNLKNPKPTARKPPAWSSSGPRIADVASSPPIEPPDQHVCPARCC